MYPGTPTRAHNPYAKQRHPYDGVVFILYGLDTIFLLDYYLFRIYKALTYRNSTFSFTKSAIFINKYKQNCMFLGFCLFLLSFRWNADYYKY